jgi:hypothetical protein
MSNTLTALAQLNATAIQEVRKNLKGLIPAVTADMSAEPVALNEKISVPVLSAAVAADATPANVSSAGSDTTVTVREVTLTKRRKSSFHATGDDTKVINRIGFDAWYKARIARAMQVLLDEVEADLAALHVKATYGCGTPGTTPFSSTFEVISTLKRLQEEAGIPNDDLTLVINPRAGENLRNRLTTVSAVGTDETLRQGIISKIEGFNIRTSAQIKTHTKSTAASYQTNGGEAAAAASITVDTGTGTVLEGDTLSVADDTSGLLYIASGAVAANELAINGALKAAIGDDKAITIASHVANMAFHRRALQLAIRPTALPPGGDGADDAMIVSDLPVAQGGTGLAFLVLRYGQYLQASYEVHATWGVGATEAEGLWKLAG